ncbi:MAG: S4 domain-containing protein [Pseudomonadota bacterium]
MRLSKYLSLCVAMSRNQLNFVIRKGRVCVNGAVVTDPYFEIGDSDKVTFDGNLVSIAQYKYVVLHKPAAYSCATTDTEYPFVLELLGQDTQDRYFYFANTLSPEMTGLVLLSDDARWANRMKRRLLNKPRVFLFDIQNIADQDRLQSAIEACLASSENSEDRLIDLSMCDDSTLRLQIDNVAVREIVEVFSGLNIQIESLHLQQIGRLSLGDLSEGEYLELPEDAVKV